MDIILKNSLPITTAVVDIIFLYLLDILTSDCGISSKLASNHREFPPTNVALVNYYLPDNATDDQWRIVVLKIYWKYMTDIDDKGDFKCWKDYFNYLNYMLTSYGYNITPIFTLDSQAMETKSRNDSIRAPFWTDDECDLKEASLDNIQKHLDLLPQNEQNLIRRGDIYHCVNYSKETPGYIINRDDKYKLQVDNYSLSNDSPGTRHDFKIITEFPLYYFFINGTFYGNRPCDTVNIFTFNMTHLVSYWTPLYIKTKFFGDIILKYNVVRHHGINYLVIFNPYNFKENRFCCKTSIVILSYLTWTDEMKTFYEQEYCIFERQILCSY